MLRLRRVRKDTKDLIFDTKSFAQRIGESVLSVKFNGEINDEDVLVLEPTQAGFMVESDDLMNTFSTFPIRVMALVQDEIILQKPVEETAATTTTTTTPTTQTNVPVVVKSAIE